MIELTPQTALMIYLCLTLATLLGIWSYHHFFARKKKIVVMEQKLIVCEYCYNAYLDQIEKGVTKCPQCGSFNKK